ncbi:homeobox domain-containing protein [Gongronella butleri]|nr:homeobox domain-containing protein [Gongronella butleri]
MDDAIMDEVEPYTRKNPLSISSLLNEESIDPIPPAQRPLTPEEKRENRKTWHGFEAQEQPTKAKRKRISSQQLSRLMTIFQQTDTPSSEVREQLANELDMTKREVQVWFQNRRAKASRARAAAVQAAAAHQQHQQLQQHTQMPTISFGAATTMPPPTSLMPSPTPWMDAPSSNLGATRRASSYHPSEQQPHGHPGIPPSSLTPIQPMTSRSQPIVSSTPPYSPSHIKPIAPRRSSIHQGLQNLSLQPNDEPRRRPHSAYVFNTSYDFSRPPPPPS